MLARSSLSSRSSNSDINRIIILWLFIDESRCFYPSLSFFLFFLYVPYDEMSHVLRAFDRIIEERWFALTLDDARIPNPYLYIFAHCVARTFTRCSSSRIFVSLHKVFYRSSTRTRAHAHTRTRERVSVRFQESPYSYRWQRFVDGE